MRYTEYHAGKAVIKDKSQISEAMAKLAAYEDTGLSPQEVENLNTFDGSQAVKATIRLQDEQRKHRWIPVEERLPEDSKYILLSFSNFYLPVVGRYEKDEEGGTFYLGDCDEEDTCVANDLFVNAWMPLPEPYKPQVLREAGKEAGTYADTQTLQSAT